MRLLKAVLSLLFFSALAAPALADAVINVNAGANAVWFDDEASPSDFELGGTGSVSASPHLSAVGGLWFGLDHSYARGTVGARVTATDVNNRNFSIGLGMVYQFASESAREEEWTPNVTVGFRPWPDQAPRVIIGGEGGYGLDSGKAHLIAAVRYNLGSF